MIFSMYWWLGEALEIFLGLVVTLSNCSWGVFPAHYTDMGRLVPFMLTFVVSIIFKVITYRSILCRLFATKLDVYWRLGWEEPEHILKRSETHWSNDDMLELL